MKRNLHAAPLMFLLMLALFSACGSGGEDTQSTGETELVLTLEELGIYNGTDGNPAYIAVDGVIYDVTNVPEWSGGKHNGFSAGKDLTNEIKNISPHGLTKLRNVLIVGRLADE